MSKLDWLINYLAEERGEKGNIPNDENRKIRLWRALINIRTPKEISNEYIEKENEYLQERLKNINIIDSKEIKTIDNYYKDTKLQNKDKIALIKCDITTLKVDAIVNPANEEGTGCYIPNHNCLDNQITTFGGVLVRLEDAKKIKELGGKLITGTAMITKGYNLPSKYIIHTTGPMVINNLTEKERELLKDCYNNSLLIAKENNIKTIAFPTISTGIYRFPKDEASKIALKTIDTFISNNKEAFDKVIITVYTDEDLEIYKNNLY